MGRSRLQRTNGCEPPTPHSRIHHHGRGTGDKFPAQKISPECLPGFSPESSPVAASDSVSPLRRDPPADKTTSCSSAAVAPSLLQPARDYLENMHNAPMETAETARLLHPQQSLLGPPPPPPPFRLRGRQRFFKHHGGTVVVVHRIEPRSPSRSAARPTATSQQPSVNSRPASRVAAWADSHHARPTAPALGSTGNIAGFAQCGCLHGKDGSLAAVLAPSCGGSPTSLLLPRRRALAARHRRKQKPARGRRS